jgi:hypothetical protein
VIATGIANWTGEQTRQMQRPEGQGLPATHQSGKTGMMLAKGKTE